MLANYQRFIPDSVMKLGRFLSGKLEFQFIDKILVHEFLSKHYNGYRNQLDQTNNQIQIEPTHNAKKHNKRSVCIGTTNQSPPKHDWIEGAFVFFYELFSSRIIESHILIDVPHFFGTSHKHPLSLGIINFNVSEEFIPKTNFF